MTHFQPLGDEYYLVNQTHFESLLYQEGRLSLAKAALLCSMIGNEFDEQLVSFLSTLGVRSVITRAGGSGDNLKSKILRNVFGAAEKSGLLQPSPRNRYAITLLVEEVIRGFDSPLLDVAGGGLKMGLAVLGNDLALGVSGKLGIPGMDVDYEVAISRTLYHYLEG